MSKVIVTTKNNIISMMITKFRNKLGKVKNLKKETVDKIVELEIKIAELDIIEKNLECKVDKLKEKIYE